MIGLTTIKNIIGRPTNLLRDKEAYIITIAEIESAHRLLEDEISLANELQKVLHWKGKINSVDEINSKSAMNYSHKVLEMVNKDEAKVERKTYIQERYDKSVSHQTQKGKENLSQDSLVFITKYVFNVSWH